MSAHKHTPGPWEVAEEDGDLFVRVVNQPASCHPMFDRYRIIHGYVGGDPTQNPEPDLGTPEANARLIAAAPELLEALQACLDKGRRWHPCDSVVVAARAAIAKATGEPA